MNGHEVIRLPPYHTDLNPIELVWGYIKGKVSEEISSSLEDKKKSHEQLFSRYAVEQWKECCQHMKNIEKEYWDNDRLLDAVIDKIIFNLEDSFDEDFSTDMGGDCAVVPSPPGSVAALEGQTGESEPYTQRRWSRFTYNLPPYNSASSSADMFLHLTSPALLGRLPGGRGCADLPLLPTGFTKAEVLCTPSENIVTYTLEWPWDTKTYDQFYVLVPLLNQRSANVLDDIIHDALPIPQPGCASIGVPSFLEPIQWINIWTAGDLEYFTAAMHDDEMERIVSDWTTLLTCERRACQVKVPILWEIRAGWVSCP
ncbi:hypothetical protein PR048_021544 [Dryococelus australis]|uniref:Tc1-like transposase DDE domain-containing protein n=1 Tax=Dryococelus australis TaxID=614101 RepID=A0ABQ9GYK7_9NEOP|nr:hypothetical protein PR048_021544 [Dryococelus australis]